MANKLLLQVEVSTTEDFSADFQLYLIDPLLCFDQDPLAQDPCFVHYFFSFVREKYEALPGITRARQAYDEAERFQYRGKSRHGRLVLAGLASEHTLGEAVLIPQLDEERVLIGGDGKAVQRERCVDAPQQDPRKAGR